MTPPAHESRAPRATPDSAPVACGARACVPPPNAPSRPASTVLALALLLALLAVLPAGIRAQEASAPWLVVHAEGRELLALPLADAPRWILRWNHSVSGVRVSDHYAFRDGTMMLTDSHTPAFDAGLGHIPGRGRQVSDGAGGYWILDLDEPVPGNAYLLRVGSAAVDHRIRHAGRSYSLSDLAAGERVQIGVEFR